MSRKLSLLHSRKQVSKAGEILTGIKKLSLKDEIWAYDVLQNFRAAHTYPINTFQSTLRDRLASIDSEALVAQRLKRTPSIVEKLLRFPEMKLARMQDIGGIRAVVKDLVALSMLYEKYKGSTRFQHELVGEKDYINNPKGTGYRGIHLIYKYKNTVNPEFDGLLLELQMRTRLQHAWATAVETVGTYLSHSLKSNQGPEDWLAFFALTGSAFAHIEKCNPVPGFQGLSEEDTYKKVILESRRLGIINKLKAFSVVTEHITNSTGAASYHLIVLDPEMKTVNIQSFARRKLDDANTAYSEYEKQIANDDFQIVLVATDSIASLRQAYPNYFLDTDQFIKAIEEIEARLRKIGKPLASNLLSGMLKNLPKR